MHHDLPTAPFMHSIHVMQKHKCKSHMQTHQTLCFLDCEEPQNYFVWQIIVFQNARKSAFCALHSCHAIIKEIEITFANTYQTLSSWIGKNVNCVISMP